ncbi:MAG TPA: cardiolipin synthase ClsB [Burkholderiaceae bacterium]|nr:cardiolipin synthase ClsB [Burkholderiaceae bacterium]
MSTPQPDQLAWYRSLKPVMQRGHEVRLLEGGNDYFPALEADCAAARSRIHLETYIFEDDVAGRRVAAALAGAAARGVEVRLVIDGFGTGELRGEVARILRASRVSVETFRPERRRFAFDRQRLRRMHRKIAVVDGRIAYVGGINVLDDLYDPNHGTLDHPRFDFAVKVRGPLVPKVHLAAERLWWELTALHRPLQTMKRLELPDDVPDPHARPGRTPAMFVLRDNFRFRRAIEKSYLRAIGRARREILIANAYFLPGIRFRRALLAARRRGVRVRLLLQGRVEYKLQHYASQALYEQLLLAGVEITEYRRSFLHAKVAVIDDWATVGSSNIDPFSLMLAREANVATQDAGFARELHARIERAIADGGQPVVLTGHRRRPWPIRLMNWFAFGILRFGVALTGTQEKF